MPALTGPITTSVGAVATSVTNNAITNAMLAQMAANTFKINNTGSPANAIDGTIAQVLTMLGIAAVLPGDCGDGRDGTAVLDGTNTVAWASKSGSVYTMTTNVQAAALTVGSGITLKIAGSAVRCRTPIANAGVIDCSGGPASGSTDGAAPIGAGALFPQTLSSGTSSSTAPQCFVASAAANGGASVGGGGSNGGNATAPGTIGRGGGGGAGGNTSPFTLQGDAGSSSPSVVLATVAGGFGDPCSASIAESARSYGGTPYTLGTWGGAGGNGSGPGGGRGAPGGYSYICCPGITGPGIVTCAGGAGGAGGSAGGGSGGGGGGGAGGILILKLQGYGNANTVSVAGGAAGLGGVGGGGGNGGNGSAGGSGVLMVL